MGVLRVCRVGGFAIALRARLTQAITLRYRADAREGVDMTDADRERAAIAEVIALDDRLRTALQDRDVALVERLYAPEFTLNSPARRIQTRQETLDLLARSGMRQTDYTRRIEAAYASGEVVVLMGEESLVWEGTQSALDGRRTHRRFTNAWRRIDGEWRQILRQATTVPAEE
jgi:hypothetical protein